MFGTVVVDPPWNYNKTSRAARLTEKRSGASDDHYAPMTTSDLADLPVGDVCDGTLLLWTVGPFIPDALELVRAWGFEYITMAYWHKSSSPIRGHLLGDPLAGHAFQHKPTYGVGYWLRGDTEPIVVAKKKGAPSYRTPTRATFVTRVGEHSAKPDVLHEWATKYLKGPYLELFARRQYPGWTCLGNELPGDNRDIRDSLECLRDTQT